MQRSLVLAAALLATSCQVVSGLSSLETKQGSGGAATSSSTGANDCGNGQLDVGEACDDANLADGDGCSSLCARECAGQGTELDPVTGDCLVMSVRPESWHAAKEQCEALGPGGHLATPGTIERVLADFDFAVKWSKFAPAESRVIDAPLAVWVGASDEAREGVWEWVDGTPWTLTDAMPPWVGANPDDYGASEDCLSFNMFYAGLNDASCAQQNPFVCQIPGVTTRCGDGIVEHDEECDLPDTEVDGCKDCRWECPGDPAWVELRTRRCFFATSSQPHDTAITQCGTGSKVATLEDIFTLGRVAARVATNHYWLGASHATGAWVWSNGIAVYPTGNMQAWAMNEPQGTMMQDCLQIETGGVAGATGKYGLRDFFCDAANPSPALCVHTFPTD